jgi:tetratricopeptide (TPR) repeat protein
MGIFNQSRSAGQAADGNKNKSDTAGQDATRLIEEGHVLETHGKLNEAMQRYLNAIHLAPNPARAHLNHGNILLLKGDLKGALDAFRTAIKHNPDYAGAYYNIGNALLGDSQLDDAVASYRRALEIQPDYAEVHCSLGVALKELGQIDSAVACYQRALIINPDLAEAHNNLDVAIRDIFSMGNVLMDNGQLDEAVANYRRVLEINPDYADAHCNLGLALQNQGQFEGALASYRRALEIKPDFAEAHYNLGNALQALGQNNGAVACFRRALEIKPDYAEAHYNLGIALQDLGQYKDAVICYQRALEINPDFAEAELNLSLLLLSLGQYAEAWPKYEARYYPRNTGRHIVLPDIPFPQWHGEPLTGKSLVIWPERGFGDEIQFARYIPMLKIRGVSRITLVCKSPLKALLETLEGVDTVIPQSKVASLPFHDYWTFSMSLPLHFSTTVETIPAKLPYLGVLPERLDKWHNRLPMGGLKVGLVWKGNAAHTNDANRSLPSFSTLAPLWSVPGVTFVSLQKGQGEKEAATPLIEHLGSGIQDFADTAAIVAQLDLVICIDTAIAHLAGALNKSCWVLLPVIDTDWRWLRERADSPWYPGVMRLFRQTKTGDWAAAIGEVAQALETWVDEHGDAI